MFSFQRIGLILTLSTVTFTGVLWYDRTTNRVAPDDIAILLSAYNERALVTRIGSNNTSYSGFPVPANTYVLTNSVNSIYTNYNGTNACFYQIPTATLMTDLYTNNFSGNQDIYQNPPIYNSTLLTSYDYSNKWILGYYESITFTGFTTPEFNGTYYSTIPTQQYYTPVYTEFTNSYGKMFTYSESGSYFSEELGPWDGGEAYETVGLPAILEGVVVTDVSIYLHDPLYPNFFLDVTLGNLRTNVNLIDRPMVSKSYIYDAYVGNTMDSFYKQLGRISHGIFGTIGAGNTYDVFFNLDNYPGYSLVPIGKLPLFYTNNIALDDYGYGSSAYGSGAYIDKDAWDLTEFDKIFDLRIKWEDMIISGLSNNVSTHNVPITGFSDYFNGVQQPSANRITKAMLTARKEVFEEMKVFLLKKIAYYVWPANPVWVRSGANNQIYGNGIGATPEAARANAILNQTYTTVDGSPFYAIEITKRNTDYACVFRCRNATLIANVSNYTNCMAKGFMSTTNIPYWGLCTLNEYGSDGANYVFQENRYVITETLADAIRTNVSFTVTHDMSVASLPTIPTVLYEHNQIGYRTRDELFIMKYTQQYFP